MQELSWDDVDEQLEQLLEKERHCRGAPRPD